MAFLITLFYKESTSDNMLISSQSFHANLSNLGIQALALVEGVQELLKLKKRQDAGL